MIPTGLVVALIVGCFFAGWATRRHQALEAERWYWARQQPAELYDWARELDL